MLEVVAVFGTSLLLRRQDLRYLALGGMLGYLLRLVFSTSARAAPSREPLYSFLWACCCWE